MLKSLRRVFVQFSPTDPRATAARELLQRVGSSAARTSNPDCVVEYKVCTSRVQVVWLYVCHRQGCLPSSAQSVGAAGTTAE